MCVHKKSDERVHNDGSSIESEKRIDCSCHYFFMFIEKNVPSHSYQMSHTNRIVLKENSSMWINGPSLRFLLNVLTRYQIMMLQFLRVCSYFNPNVLTCVKQTSMLLHHSHHTLCTDNVFFFQTTTWKLEFGL